MVKRGNTGFTLVELVIAMLIVSVLVGVALPSYTQYVTKSRRVAAEACLANYASFMERFYATNMRYDLDVAAGTAMDNAALKLAVNMDCASNANTGQYYDYKFESGVPGQSAYELRAEPKGTQLKNDKACGIVTLDQTGAHGTEVAGASAADCWSH